MIWYDMISHWNQATGPTSVRLRDEAAISAEKREKDKEKEKVKDAIWGDSDIPSEDVSAIQLHIMNSWLAAFPMLIF